jgi:hypothetical protein
MEYDRDKKPGGSAGNPSGVGGWSPTSQPGPASGPESIGTKGMSTGRGFHREDDDRDIGMGATGSAASPGRQAGGELAGEVRRGVQDLREKAVEQGNEMLNKVQGRVSDAVESGKGRIADQIGAVGSAIQEAVGKLEGENEMVGRYARMAVDQINGLSDYLRDADPAAMAREAQRFARRRPDVFLGGALITGLVIGRFLRSHEPRPEIDRGPLGRHDFDQEDATFGEIDHDAERSAGITTGIGAAVSGAGTGLSGFGSSSPGSTGLGAGAGTGVGSIGSGLGSTSHKPTGGFATTGGTGGTGLGAKGTTGSSGMGVSGTIGDDKGFGSSGQIGRSGQSKPGAQNKPGQSNTNFGGGSCPTTP